MWQRANPSALAGPRRGANFASLGDAGHIDLPSFFLESNVEVSKATAVAGRITVALFAFFFGNLTCAAEAVDSWLRKEVVYEVPKGVSSSDFASAIADSIEKGYAKSSRFGPVEAAGARKGGLLGMGEATLLSKGVATSRVALDAVHVSYINQERKQSMPGASWTSTTEFDLRVLPSLADPGHYLIVATPVTERIYHSPLIQVAPLDTKEQIAGDAEAALSKGLLDVVISLPIEAEFDVSYPPASVFANFERRLGPPYKRSDGGGDAREGIFPYPSSDVADLKIRIYPYHSGSKVEVTFSAKQVVKADGGPHLPQTSSDGVLANLKAIGAE